MIHPPILYAGYVGFTIPFSFAIAALVTGRFGEGWLADVRRTTLVAFGFLTVGIVLGAFWSYAVLGWGGYWGWDPVENASLLPWLTAVAFIHSVMVQERRGMLRVWNLSLVIATFCLTILGTFLTRSGVLNSVHAFSTSSIGPWLLTFLGLSAALGRRPDRVARRPAAVAGPHRLAAVARGRVPAQQPAVRRLRARRAHRHGVPAARAGAPEQADHGGRALLRQAGRADRARAPVPDGRRARAAVAGRERGDVAQPAAGAGVDRRAHARRVRARRRARHRRRDRLRARCVRARERRPFGGRRRARAPARDVGGAAGRGGAHGARQPAPLRRAARARRRRRARDGVGDHVGLHDQARGAARARAVDDRARVHRHLPAHQDGRRRAEDDRSRPTVRVRRGSTDLGTFHPAISSYPNFPDGIGTPAIHSDPWHDVYLTLVSAPERRAAAAGRSRSACRSARS